ncbi:MAG TPA: T9SS type A sorting domain-containing protein [Flavipsychrobacter sp.]|nr:T9SS type A sorting domain-containing protein [Flavipsychrobacter sp.]
MKKLLLWVLFAVISLSAFAQSVGVKCATVKTSIPPNVSKPSSILHSSARKAGVTTLADSLLYQYDVTQWDADTLEKYPFYYGSTMPHDSGYFFGTNGLLAGTDIPIGVAQAYSFPYSGDTSWQVIGVASEWFGNVEPGSTNTVSFKIWGLDTNLHLVEGHYYLGDLPGPVLDSATESFSSLGVNSGNVHYTFFPTPLPASLNADQRTIYAGFELRTPWASLGGDTIHVGCTRDLRYGVSYYTDGAGDTIITGINAYEAGDVWLNLSFDLNIQRLLSLSPIVNVNAVTTNVKGIKANDLTFFGNYPNPASTTTNIKFALQSNADITIKITDLSGRTIQTIHQAGLSAGEHIAPVNTSAFAAGDYIYVVQSSHGGSMAAKMTVVR